MIIEKQSSDSAYNKINGNNRIEYLDIIKGIAIILMVIGHMASGNLRNFIYSFHMPLFFIISGYFYKKRTSRDQLLRIINRFLLPYVATCFFILVITIIRNYLNGISISSDIIIWIQSALLGNSTRIVLKECTNIFEKSHTVGPIWFFFAIMWTELLFNVIYNKLNNNIERSISVIIVFLIGFYTSKYIWLPFSTQIGMTCIIYYFIGLIMRNNNVLNIKRNKFVQVMCILIWIISIFYGKIEMSINYYKMEIFDICASICGSYFMVLLCKNISVYTKYINKVLIYLGKNTVIIICIHTIERMFIHWGAFCNSQLIIFILRISLIGICCFIFRNIPLLKKIYAIS